MIRDHTDSKALSFGQTTAWLNKTHLSKNQKIKTAGAHCNMALKKKKQRP